MKSDNILGPKEDVKAILKALGIKEDDKPQIGVDIMQEFINIPNVGEVTKNRLYVNDIIRECSKGIDIRGWSGYIDLADSEKWFDNKPLVDINWYSAIELAKSLGLELLSNKEYWQCLKWALGNDKHFAASLRYWTWTSSVIVWEKEYKHFYKCKIEESLLYNCSDNSFPVVIENPEIAKEFKKREDDYIIKAGNVIRPHKKLCAMEGSFDFSDLEEKTAIPFHVHDRGKFYLHLSVGPCGAVPIGCGSSLEGGSYTIFADWFPSAVGFGMFLKKPGWKNKNI